MCEEMIIFFFFVGPIFNCSVANSFAYSANIFRRTHCMWKKKKRFYEVTIWFSEAVAGNILQDLTFMQWKDFTWRTCSTQFHSLGCTDVTSVSNPISAFAESTNCSSLQWIACARMQKTKELFQLSCEKEAFPKEILCNVNSALYDILILRAGKIKEAEFFGKICHWFLPANCYDLKCKLNSNM